MVKKLYTTKEIAVLLGVSKAFLERDRHQGAKIPFRKIGSRTVRYHQDDIDKYLAQQLRTSTGKTTEAR